MKKFLTIGDVAKALGYSRQAIYYQINKKIDLGAWFKIVNGKYMINPKHLNTYLRFKGKKDGRKELLG